MADQKDMHTVPTDDVWTNRREGARRTQVTKAEAQAAGRTAAEKDDVST